MDNQPEKKEAVYYIKGMHCASCEILIEKKLLELQTVKSAEASLNKGKVIVEFEGRKPDINKLNKIFRENNYSFSETSFKKSFGFNFNDFAVITGTVLIIISIFVLIEKSGLSALINVNKSSSLPVFFVFGLLAGVSTCAALVGGIILSMSKQWAELYKNENSFIKKSQPHILFNAGRIVSYGVFGSLLGLVSGQIKFSPVFSSALILIVSLLMVLFSFDMLGINWFGKFQITMPKFMTRYVSDENHFKGKYMPLIMGAGTFFLPCGFTVTVQSLALLSGNILQGGLIMSLFALGTAPMLLAIGLSSIGFSKNQRTSVRFMKIAGILVLFFAVFNINSQLNAMGFKSLNNLNIGSVFQTSEKNSGVYSLPPIVNGKQIVKMDVSVSGYDPSYIKVRAGIPVKWEINDTGTSGCTNALISRDLFSGQIALTPGEMSEKEFTIQNPGKYKFSCWMGMISGVIEAVK